MELNHEKKYACKFCNKRYPCGKSLGGHIRTHMNNEILAETPLRNLISSKKFIDSANYGLRENAKKTKRLSDSGKGSSSLVEMMICKECGKGFGSLKALCGHMSCHSEKREMIMDSQSDTETSTPSKRRSKRVKYKAINNSYNMGNGSSSVSEIVQKQEEVAMCLMMLSRDSSGWKKGLNFNSVADSSDNNSVVLEEKSSSIDVRITIKNNKLKQKCVEYDSPSENSDSGYFRNGPKKVESVDAFLKNIEFRRKAEKILSSKKNKGHECPFCFRVFKSGQALGGHKRSHFVGGSDDRTFVIKQGSHDMPALIDLNLPAPGFMPW